MLIPDKFCYLPVAFHQLGEFCTAVGCISQLRQPAVSHLDPSPLFFSTKVFSIYKSAIPRSGGPPLTHVCGWVVGLYEQAFYCSGILEVLFVWADYLFVFLRYLFIWADDYFVFATKIFIYLIRRFFCFPTEIFIYLSRRSFRSLKIICLFLFAKFQLKYPTMWNLMDIFKKAQLL